MSTLLIVDMQNDFMPNGPLPTRGADSLVPIINELMQEYPVILATQDWHPKNHVSFAPNHPGKKVGDVVIVEGIEQILWPVHCVQNTKGAELVAGLKTDAIQQIFYKGIDPLVDSYSAFFDNAKKRKTGLEVYLRQHAIQAFSIVGVLTDYCVLYSVLDALALGFDVTVIAKGCRAINKVAGDEQKAFAAMKEKGAKIRGS